MRGRRRIANQPIRLVAGASMVNAGMEKLNADYTPILAVPETADGVGPPLVRTPTGPFVKLLGAAEVGIGAALVLPLLSDVLVGLFLTAFVGAKFLARRQNEGVGQPPQATTRPNLVKETWLFGIGVTLLATGRGRRSARAKPEGSDALP
jgi:hypothetical protein